MRLENVPINGSILQEKTTETALRLKVEILKDQMGDLINVRNTTVFLTRMWMLKVEL
jgi:hypothetical protein